MQVFLKYWLPLLIWLAVIFVDSTDLMSAEHTSRFIVPILLWLKPGMAPETLRSILFAMRKCAHVSEYAILALLLWRALRSGSALRAKISILFGAVLLGCAVVAAGDEFHQSFVKSRTSSVRDVFWDIAGALIGLLICASFAYRHPKRNRGTTQSQFVDARL
ncbi:MAG TPA: VanZ family protein [Candidatus Udaeobacter sp.]|nr:VanZ family protein [Candidatus Udaeobacter sp.]